MARFAWLDDTERLASRTFAGNAFTSLRRDILRTAVTDRHSFLDLAGRLRPCDSSCRIRLNVSNRSLCFVHSHLIAADRELRACQGERDAIVILLPGQGSRSGVPSLERRTRRD